MISALITFLGGSVFRMLWGEITAFIGKAQDHNQELAMLKAQAENDAAAHQRSLENIRVQAELNVQQIQVQKESTISTSEADAFLAAQKTLMAPTGIWFVDLWNGIIRPSYATVALILWLMKLYVQGFKMDDFDMSLVGIVSGFFFADRSLRKSGK